MTDRNGPAAIDVLIVEDHQMVAEMSARILADEPDIHVIGWVKTIAEAQRSVAEQAVDVVLMDYRLPDGDGVSAATQIRRDHPSTRVVIVTGVEDDAIFRDAIAAGCSGYLCKSESVDNLATAVRAAHAGSTAVSPDMLAVMMRSISEPKRKETGNDLSARELDVLRLLCEGLPNDEIAERLFLSPHTVRNHTQNILEKLDVHSKLEAVTKALRTGLVSIPSRG